MHQIVIISENTIFTQLIQSFLLKEIPECMVVQFQSFSALKKRIGQIFPDVIVADGIISGAASFEIINYLRLERKFVGPIYFFSEVRNEDFKLKAYETGVNFFFEKPFDPKEVTACIIKSLSELIP